MNGQARVIQICREQAARMRHAIQKMEDGTMATMTMRNGQRVDTTAETIAEFSTFIVELEASAARVEAENAQGS